MKLVMLYTIWAGEDMDMLQKSIDYHRNSVDHFAVFVQEHSNTGFMEYADDSVLKKTGAEIIYYSPGDGNTKEKERQKHDKMIQYARNIGATHFILSAADHFYSKSSFDNALKIMQQTGADVTITRMITYYKRSDWALWPIEEYGMPFIHKIGRNTHISRREKYPIKVDPSVMVSCSKPIILIPSHAVLHHYSMVRPKPGGIMRKFRNAAASIRWHEFQVIDFKNEYDNAAIGNRLLYFQGLTINSAETVLKSLNVPGETPPEYGI